VVAQRVSTILGADQIVVLEDGRVVGQGRHEELLETCPTYVEIVESQAVSMRKPTEALRSSVPSTRRGGLNTRREVSPRG
jgi:ABC-type glutathione transport system ATPase component